MLTPIIVEQKISISILKYAAKKRILKPFALYLCISGRFKHANLYYPTAYAKWLGKSPKTIKKYLVLLIEHGFAEKRGKCWQLLAQDTICKRKELPYTYMIISSRPWTSFQRHLDEMERSIILINTQEQEFNAIRKGAKIPQHSVLRLKTAKRAIGLRPLDPTKHLVPCKIWQSSYSLGRNLGLSHTTVLRHLRQLQNRRMLKYGPNVTEWKETSYSDFCNHAYVFNYHGNGHLIYKHGMILIHHGVWINILKGGAK